MEFGLQGKCGDAAENQTGHDYAKPEASCAKMVLRDRSGTRLKSVDFGHSILCRLPHSYLERLSPDSEARLLRKQEEAAEER